MIQDIFVHFSVDFPLTGPQKALIRFAGFLMRSGILFNHLKKRGIPVSSEFDSSPVTKFSRQVTEAGLVLK